MEISALFETDLQTIDLLKNYLEEHVGSDRHAAFNTTIDQDRLLIQIEPAVIAIVEKTKEEKSSAFLALSDGYNGWRQGRIILNYFLTNNKAWFLSNIGDFRSFYFKEAKKELFEKRLSDMTGREFNIYLQIINVVRP